MRKFALLLSLIAVPLAVGAPAAKADNPNPGVLPVGSTAFGQTYGEWSAAWWNWAASQTLAKSAVADTTGANCGVGQSGPVWFLAGTTGGFVTRTCTIPSDTAILFPIINGECSTAEGNGTTDAELAACAKDLMDHVTAKDASIDGTPLVNLDSYRVGSPLFTLRAVRNNAFGIPAGKTNSVAEGFWILLAPLSAGQHTIQFHGTAVFGTFTFEEGVTYNLTVQ
jgi:hypothetical protein